MKSSPLCSWRMFGNITGNNRVIRIYFFNPIIMVSINNIIKVCNRSLCSPHVHLQFWEVTYPLQQWYDLQVHYCEFKTFPKSMIVSILLLVYGIHSLMVLCEMLLKALEGRFKKAEESDLCLALLHYRSALWKLA